MAIPTPTILYKFDNNANDSGSGSYPLTVSGATYDTRRIVDGSSRSLYIDGTNDYAYRGSSPWKSLSTSLTVAFWAYPTAYGWAGCGVNFGGNGTVSANTVRFGIDNGGVLAINQIGFVSYRWSGVGAGAGWRWDFYCIVYKGTWDKVTPANTAHCFKNRTKYTNTTCDGSGTNPSPHNSLSIGRVYIDWAANWYYSGGGYMDNVYIWNSALTDAQVYALYDYTAPKFALQSYA